jgi:hypothetical protein
MRKLRNRFKLATVTVTFVIAVACALVQAREGDIFVDNVNGDDLWSGQLAEPGAPEGPTRSITKALRMAGPGQRIVLANSGKPYRECITLAGSRHSGIFDRPFTIEGNGATLSGSAPVPVDLWNQYRGDVFRFPLKQLGYQQLFLGGQPARRFVRQDENRGPADLEPLTWMLDGGYLYFRVEPGRLPHQYEPSFAQHQAGITLYKVQGVAIVDLVVEGFQIDGIQVHDSRGPCVLTRVTSRGNGRSGIAVVGASEAAIDRCVIGGNGQSQLHVEGPADARVTESELQEQVAPAWQVKGGKLFVDGRQVGE